MATSSKRGTSRVFLGLLLFLNKNITSKILKLADDSKLFRTVGSYDNTGNSQSDLYKLAKWSEK